VTDFTMSDAIFLSLRPSWSQADLDSADQDIVDLLSAIDYERSVQSQEADMRAAIDSRDTAQRSRLGLMS
jgi:hypothetical protein